ncbi:MAG: GntR family transcriptional regulator [Planctomycetes bacterium]|nr:GntR family transcriptional regulator [Planctomycetota bacterium]
MQQMILSGQCRSGSKLVQIQLARQLGVAQCVVREALLELQASGLVETVDNRGAFVGELNAERLLESFDVREAHECLAVRLCCQHATRAQLRELAELADRIWKFAAAGGHDEEMASLDREFHQRLIHLSGNSMLVRLSEHYRALGKVVRAGRDPRMVRDEHLALLKAIEEGREEDAVRLVRDHIRAAKKAVEEQILSRSFVPKWV